MVVQSVWIDSQREIDIFKWVESERAGYDLGESAIRKWIKDHWCGYLRARWVEHLQGKTFWTELDSGDFGLMQRDFQEKALLLDRIVAGQENLHIVRWCQDWNIDKEDVLEILISLDINSKRLAHRFES
jgi:hypothetical protein